MTFYGPWLTPPRLTTDVSYDVTPTPPYVVYVAGAGSSFADVCEDTGPGELGAIHDNEPGHLWVSVPDVASDGTLTWEIQHRPLLFDTAQITLAAAPYVPPSLPRGATGVGYETPFPTDVDRAGYVDAASMTFTVRANDPMGGLDGEQFYPGPLTAELRASSSLDGPAEYLTGAALATKTLVWSRAIPASYSVILTQTASFDLPALAAAGVKSLWLTYAEQISHDDSGLPLPPAPTNDPFRFGGGRIDVVNYGPGLLRSVILHIAWTPSRYRYIYDKPPVQPPLRQFPRDDFLGGAPRQDHSSTSVQASNRQGFIGTYR